MEPLLNTTTRSSCALDYDFKSTTLFWFVVTFSRRLKIKLISRSDVMEEKIYSMPVAGGERFVLHLKTAGIIISFDDLEILVISNDPATW